jgi:hypothetical protein
VKLLPQAPRASSCRLSPSGSLPCPGGSSHDQGPSVRFCVYFSSRSPLPLRSDHQELARCYTGKIAIWVSPPLTRGLSTGSTFDSGQNRWGRRCSEAADPGADDRAARHLAQAHLRTRPPRDAPPGRWDVPLLFLHRGSTSRRGHPWTIVTVGVPGGLAPVPERYGT